MWRNPLAVELKRSYVTRELLGAAVGPREPDLVRVQLCLGPCDFGKCSKVKKKWLKMKRLQLETWSAGQIGTSVCFTCSSSSSSRICYQNILEGGGVVQKLSARWGGTNTRRHWWIISQESIRNQKQKAEHGHWPAHWSYTARVMLSYTCLIGQQAMISYVLISNLELSISYQGDDQRKSCFLLQDLGTKTWIQN